MTATPIMTKHLAVVGAGAWGRNLVRNFAELRALRTICDGNPRLQSQYETEYPGVGITGSFQQVLDDEAVKAVVVATPAETHYALVAKAIRAGKDVFVEKPMALRREDGAALVDLAAKHQRILMVGHVLQYHPAIRELKAILDRGTLGKIQYVYSNRLNLGKIRTEENILWSFAPHDISVMLMLLGETPTVISAQAGSFLQAGRADVTMTTMTFASGVKGHIFVSWLHPYKDQRLVVVGDRSMAVFDDVEPVDKLRLYAHEVDWIGRQPVARRAEAIAVPIDTQEPLRLECEHFLECVATRRKPQTDGSEGLAVLSVLAACQESLDRNAAPVPLPAPARPTSYFAHPTAVIDQGCEIGRDTKIWHFSHVMTGSTIGARCSLGQNVVVGPNATVGDGVKIQNNVSIYQGVTIEDDVFCGPSMVFTNVINPRSAVARMHELRPTVVRRGASIGANATIVCGHSIGSYSFVGAGAVVTRDVPDNAIVVGNPARVVGWMCRCGVRLRFGSEVATCDACGASYLKEGNGVTEAVPSGA
jgi:UDP-2-acetamido-3-amino-2,3-dideoxy-glucuronate N-acetyltransferase